MWEESRRKRLKESEDKRHSWAGHEGVGGVFGLRSNSEADVEAALKREGLLELLMTSPHSSPLRFGSSRRSRQQKNMTFDPCGADVLPPIHSLSIAQNSIVTEEPEIQNKSLSVEESQNNEQYRNTEVTPNVTFDPPQTGLEVMNDNRKESENTTEDNVKPTSESAEATQSIQTNSKRAVGSKNRPSPSSSTKPSSSSSCLRKVVPLRTQIPAKKTQAVRAPPQEKMCRATLDRRSPRTSARDSTVKPPGFARNTVASATRNAVAPGNQLKAAPKPSPVTQTPPPPLRLSQTPAGRLRKSSSAVSENSVFIRGSRDKTVKPVWR